MWMYWQKRFRKYYHFTVMRSLKQGKDNTYIISEYPKSHAIGFLMSWYSSYIFANPSNSSKLSWMCRLFLSRSARNHRWTLIYFNVKITAYFSVNLCISRVKVTPPLQRDSTPFRQKIAPLLAHFFLKQNVRNFRFKPFKVFYHFYFWTTGALRERSRQREKNISRWCKSSL